eukprot:TRINITY_DN74713_c0_g1_i1.p1 TRINITY_DN74713_c0_g1~~TRINITY_DN74713_c0_g1_i1.p1  ORF type:complete len:1150 (-),score=244.35 TRINITY_DN74713_c0_g1_i1:33-3482(-)
MKEDVCPEPAQILEDVELSAIEDGGSLCSLDERSVDDSERGGDVDRRNRFALDPQAAQQRMEESRERRRRMTRSQSRELDVRRPPNHPARRYDIHSIRRLTSATQADLEGRPADWSRSSLAAPGARRVRPSSTCGGRSRSQSCDSLMSASSAGGALSGLDACSNMSQSQCEPIRKLRSQNGHSRSWRSERRGESLAQFRAALVKREGNYARAWRLVLDPQRLGRLTQMDICKAAREIGFAGSVRRVWDELDTDRNGSITISELDWNSADLLGKFYWLLLGRFGNVQQAAAALALQDRRRLRKEQFVMRLRELCLFNDRESEQLFHMLKTSAAKAPQPAVSKEALTWLSSIAAHLPKPQPGRARPGEDMRAPQPEFPEIDHDLCADERLDSLSDGGFGSLMDSSCRRTPSPQLRGLSPCSSASTLLTQGSIQQKAILSSPTSGQLPSPFSVAFSDDSEMPGKGSRRSSAATVSTAYVSTELSEFSQELTRSFSKEPSRMERSLSAVDFETIHDKLYREALEHRERQREYVAMRDQAMQPEPEFPLDPELYERLHRDAEDIAQSRAELADAYYRALLPPEDERRCIEQFQGVYCNDIDAFERLTAPRMRRSPSVPSEPCHRTLRRPSGLIAGSNHRCLKLYKRGLESAQKKAFDRIEREEAQRRAESADSESRKLSRPNYALYQKLYEDHARMKHRQDFLKQQLASEEEAQLQAMRRGRTGSPRPDIFYRLYMDGASRQHSIDTKRQQLEMEEETQLKMNSVHRAANRRNDVFERLHKPNKSMVEDEDGCKSLSDVSKKSKADIITVEKIFSELGLDMEPDAEEPPSSDLAESVTSSNLDYRSISVVKPLPPQQLQGGAEKRRASFAGVCERAEATHGISIDSSAFTDKPLKQRRPSAVTVCRSVPGDLLANGGGGGSSASRKPMTARIGRSEKRPLVPRPPQTARPAAAASAAGKKTSWDRDAHLMGAPAYEELKEDVQQNFKDMLLRHAQTIRHPSMPAAASTASSQAQVEQLAGPARSKGKKWDAMSSLEDLSGSLSLDGGSSLEVPRAHNASADWNAAMEALQVGRHAAPAVPDLNLRERGLTSSHSAIFYEAARGDGSDRSFDDSSLASICASLVTSARSGASIPKSRHSGLEALREMRRAQQTSG